MVPGHFAMRFRCGLRQRRIAAVSDQRGANRPMRRARFQADPVVAVLDQIAAISLPLSSQAQTTRAGMAPGSARNNARTGCKPPSAADQGAGLLGAPLTVVAAVTAASRGPLLRVGF
jgi:hypothetical protein